MRFITNHVEKYLRIVNINLTMAILPLFIFVPNIDFIFT